MLELAQLAQDAVTTLTPLLTLVAAKAGEGFLSEPGAKLFSWLTEKIKSTPEAKPLGESLDRAVAEPQNPRRLQSLQLEIEDLADKNQDFRQQLDDLLKTIAAEKGIAASQSATQTGNGNKLAQATGKNISIKIR